MSHLNTHSTNTNALRHNITVAILFFLLSNFALAQTTYYVDASEPNNNGDGLTWVNAKRDLQDVLDLAITGDEVRVASGIYIPSQLPTNTDPIVGNPGVQDHTFHIYQDIIIKGSFIPDNDSDPTNDVQNYNQPSILSGDVLQDDTSGGSTTENLWHVLLLDGLSNASIIDGFTITGGNANSTGFIRVNGVNVLKSLGGGIYLRNTAATVSNMVVTQNTSITGGSGIYNLQSPAVFDHITVVEHIGTQTASAMFIIQSGNVQITNSLFENNIGNGGVFGAALSNRESTLNISNTRFSGNTNNNQAGAFYNTQNGMATLTNVIFNDNSSGFRGGAIEISNSSGTVTLNNTVFAGNVADSQGGAIYHTGVNTQLHNATFFNNRTSIEDGGGAIYTENEDITLFNTVLFGARLTITGNNDLNNFISLPGRNIAGSNVNSASSHIAANNIDGDIHNRPGFVGLTGNPFINSDDLDGDDNIFGTFDDGLVPAFWDDLYDTGNDNLNNTSFDVSNQNRIFDQNIDIGAYELNDADTCSIFTHGIVYVRVPALGDANGTNWANPMRSLQGAIDIAEACDNITEVRVMGALNTFNFATEAPRFFAGGTGNQEISEVRSFHIQKDIRLRGGFFGDSDDDPTNDVQITSVNGNLSRMRGRGVGSTLITANLTDASLIEGFSITGGRADFLDSYTYGGQSFINREGGGMQNKNSSPTIRLIEFANNVATLGGAIHNNSQSFPKISNVFFFVNEAAFGGAIATAPHTESTDQYVEVTNCLFRDNSATSSGGAIFNAGSLKLTNSVVIRNTALLAGGIRFLIGNPSIPSSAIVTNCTIFDNTSNNMSGGIFNESPNSILHNTVLYGNTSPTDANIGGTTNIHPSSSYNASESNGAGIENGAFFVPLTVNPFIDIDAVMFSNIVGLAPNNQTPMLDGGDNTLNTEAVDILGNNRVNGSFIDIGAIESNEVSVCSQFNTPIVYVDVNATAGNNSGQDWDNAYINLQTALLVGQCQNINEIRVASGTYLPTQAPDGSTDTRDYTFYLKSNIILKGSFVPDSDNNPNNDVQDYNQPTILSGDLGIENDNSDNVYHVLVTINLTNFTLIDGFEISGGNANGSDFLTFNGVQFDRNRGGGMNNRFSSPTLSNLNITGNSASFEGGGMYNQDASPSVSLSSFTNNTATDNGGGMHNIFASPLLNELHFENNTANQGGGMYNFTNTSTSLTNCSFVNNNATGLGGGAIFNNEATLITLTNVLLSNNTASGIGGGFYNRQSTLRIINTTFFENSANSTAALFNENGALLTLHNTAFYGNIATIMDSEIAGGFNTESSNNASDFTTLQTSTNFVDLSSFTAAEIFTDPSNINGLDGSSGSSDDGLIPLDTSPLIDAGDNTQNLEPFDIAGQDRIQLASIDIGAYEGDSTLSNEDFKLAAVLIYPNPVQRILHIATGNVELESIAIYNISGQQIIEQSSDLKRIDVGDLASGIYFIKLNANLGTRSMKFIKD